jgi:hypothetical protein
LKALVLITGLWYDFLRIWKTYKIEFQSWTDHGAAAPLFVFGKSVRASVVGNNPSIPTSVSANDNIPFQYDFRSIYASLLSQWFCVSNTDLQTIMFKDFQSLPLITNSTCAVTGLNNLINNSGEELIVNYPNPFVDSTKITFKTNGGHTWCR